MPQSLSFAKDVNGANTYAPEFPDYKLGCNLAPATERTFTVPSTAGRWIIAFCYPASPSIYVAVNATASAPPSGIFEQISSTKNPGQLTVHAGNTISLYNNGTETADIVVIFYADS